MATVETTRRRSTGRDTVAVVVWSAGSLVLPVVGWVVGVVLVCASPTFRRSDCVLALVAPPLGLFWPVHLLGSVGQSCGETFEIEPDGRERLIASTCDTGWGATEAAWSVLLLVLVAAAVCTTVRLARRVASTR